MACPCRETIYSKQFEGYCEIVEWMEKIMLYLTMYAESFEELSQKLKLSEDAIEKEVKKTIEEPFGTEFNYDALIIKENTLLYTKWHCIIPEDLTKAFLDFCGSLPKKKPTSTKQWEGIKPTLENAERNLYQVTKEYFKFS